MSYVTLYVVTTYFMYTSLRESIMGVIVLDSVIVIDSS